VDSVGLVEIFAVMLLSTLFSIGGGSGQIPVIQGRWVEPGVLAPDLFSFALAITFIGPGPRTGFIAGVGYYLAGLPGAVVALSGLVLPTVLGAAGVSVGLDRMEKIVKAVAPSSGFVIAALIAAAAWGVAAPLGLRPAEIAAAGLVAGLIAWRNTDPIWLVLAAIGVGLVLSFAR
jgi:chromate transporter